MRLRIVFSLLILVFFTNVQASKIKDFSSLIKSAFMKHKKDIPIEIFSKRSIDHASKHDLINLKKSMFNLTLCFKCKNFQDSSTRLCIYQDYCGMQQSFTNNLHDILSKDSEIKSIEVEKIDKQDTKGYLIDVLVSPTNIKNYFQTYNKGDEIKIEGKSIIISNTNSPIGFDKNLNIIDNVLYRFFISELDVKKYEENEEGVVKAISFSNAFPIKE